jgi:hypothetical protein
MSRFEVAKNVPIVNSMTDEEERFTVIIDRSKTEHVVVESCGIDTWIKHGFVRCQGPYYVGTYGRETPIYSRDQGVYYASVTRFDGVWSFGHGHIAESSGTGKLWLKLEEVSLSAGIPVEA